MNSMITAIKDANAEFNKIKVWEQQWEQCYENEHDKQLCRWLNWYFDKKIQMPDAITRCNALWIKGPPGCGKTRFIRTLKKFATILEFHVDGQTKWNDAAMNAQYNFILLDEWFDAITKVIQQYAVPATTTALGLFGFPELGLPLGGLIAGGAGLARDFNASLRS